MKMSVAGSAGFIGSAVVFHLIANTQDFVINIDKLTHAGNLKSFESVNSNNHDGFENVDIFNHTKVTRVLRIISQIQ